MPGEVWLLLHGTPLTSAVWDGVRPTLDAEGPVIAPLLPTPSGTAGAQSEIAPKVLAVIDGPAKPFHLVGHSFGGQVALEVAILAPQRLASLTILCSRASPFPALSASAALLRAGDSLDVDTSLRRWFLPAELAADGAVWWCATPAVASSKLTGRCGPTSSMPSPPSTVVIRSLRSLSRPRLSPPSSIRSARPKRCQRWPPAFPVQPFDRVANASHMSQFLDSVVLAGRLLAGAGV